MLTPKKKLAHSMWKFHFFGHSNKFDTWAPTTTFRRKLEVPKSGILKLKLTYEINLNEEEKKETL